jgi:CRP/FNR family cyclic AMP-dependent transcriptional regulator
MRRGDLERLVLEKPRVGLKIIDALSERLVRYESRIEDLSLKDAPARLASLILHLIELEGVVTRTGTKIPTRYTHEQLAAMIGARRETVTKAFTRLQEIGAVELKRRRIHVRDPEALELAAGKRSQYSSVL